MNRNGLFNLAIAGLVGLAFCVSAGIVNAQDAGKSVIATPNAPEAIGPYSQAIRSEKPCTFPGRSQSIQRTSNRWEMHRSKIRRGVFLRT